MNNWKTTLAGAITAALVAIQPLVTTGKLDPHAILIAAAIAALGYLAKDANGPTPPAIPADHPVLQEPTRRISPIDPPCVAALLACLFLSGCSTWTKWDRSHAREIYVSEDRDTNTVYAGYKFAPCKNPDK